MLLDVPTSFRRDWRRLWKLAERVAEEVAAAPPRRVHAFDNTPATVLGFAGLYLESPYQPGRISQYRTGPRNGITFASTGGDGTHFCALFGEPDAAVAPVVLTVPLADEPNQVVGASLPEFLALGCVTGYHFDSLTFDHYSMVEELQTTRTPDDPDRARLLNALTEEFDLEPWPDVAGRLDQLAAQYSTDINWIPA